MATRTISNTGGNYNSTGTWVEGAVPTSADDVVSTATSGQLTVNVASAARTFDLSTYTNTLTMNNNWTIGGASLTSTIGSGMTFAGTVGALIINAAHTLNQIGTKRVPILQFGTGTKTLNTDIYSNVFRVASTQTINGNKLYCNSDFGLLTQSTIPGIYCNGTTEFVLDGSGLISHAGNNKVTVNTSSQYDTIGRGLVLGSSIAAGGGELDWLSGTTGIFNCILVKSVNNADNYTLNFNVPTANILLETKSVNSIGSNRNMNIILNGPLNISSLGSYSVDRLYTTDATPITAIFSGNSVSATTLNFKPAFRTTSSTTFPVASNGQTNQAINVKLDENYTHYIGSMNLNGGTDKAAISSITGGVQVPLNLIDKETSQIYNYDFTDVDASGGEQIVAILGTLSNTTNITTTYPSGGGGGESSFTFVN